MRFLSGRKAERSPWKAKRRRAAERSLSWATNGFQTKRRAPIQERSIACCAVVG